MKTSVVSSVIVLAACSLLTGCASIISGRNADVAIDSFPSNAHVIIHDNNGRQVASLNTPGVVSLKRNRRYFLPARYTAIDRSARIRAGRSADSFDSESVDRWQHRHRRHPRPDRRQRHWRSLGTKTFRDPYSTRAARRARSRHDVLRQSSPCRQIRAETPQYVADRTGQAAPSPSNSQDDSRPTSTR